MNKKVYNKLIRDNIPELIGSSGGCCATRVLESSDFELELKNKLVEEAQEVRVADGKHILEELADVLEVVKTLASNHKITFDMMERQRVKKLKTHGGFTKKLLLKWSSRVE